MKPKAGCLKKIIKFINLHSVLPKKRKNKVSILLITTALQCILKIYITDLKICICESFSFVFLSENHYLGSFVAPYKFQYCSSSVKNVGIVIRIPLNLQIALGSTDILIILILPICEHRISCHLFVSLLFLSLKSLYKFYWDFNIYVQPKLQSI